MLRVLAQFAPGLILIAACGATAAAQFSNATLSVDVGALASLSLSFNSLSFSDADPDVLPVIPATQGPLTLTAKARATRNSTVTLSVIASDNFRSGVSTIPIEALTWTAAGAGFVGGTMSRTTPQLVASWTGSGTRTGYQEYGFRNLWTHPTGTFTVTLTYTLTAP